MPMDQLERRYEEEVAEEHERRAFFNKAEARADFTDWAKADCWTLEEAVALCLGREPGPSTRAHLSRGARGQNL